MQEFIFKLHPSDIAFLAAVRCMEGLSAAMDDQSIWLRGIREPVAMALKQLPVKNSFTINGQQQLFIPGNLTPIDILKELSWQPLSSFIPVATPVSALPGKTSQRIPIQLVPATQVQEGAALLTSLAIWKQYAETAPAVRLGRLRFAVSEHNEVVITGHPLPPLPGKEYWLTNTILLPCGYDFELPMAKDFILEKLNPQKDSILLFHTNGQWQAIGNTCFVEAKRSAVRLTREKQS